MSVRRELLRQRGEQEYQQKRRDIVRAAAEVFRRKGYRSANIADIAAEAGMDRATLYLYSPGKDELFQAVVRDAVEGNVLMIEEVQGQGSDAPAKLDTLIRRLIASYARHYPYLFVYVQENLAELDDGTDWGREMRALGRRFDDAITAIIADGLAAGSLKAPPGADAKVIAYGLIGMCNWTHRWFRPDGRRSAEEIGALYAAITLQGLT